MSFPIYIFTKLFDPIAFIIVFTVFLLLSKVLTLNKMLIIYVSLLSSIFNTAIVIFTIRTNLSLVEAFIICVGASLIQSSFIYISLGEFLRRQSMFSKLLTV